MWKRDTREKAGLGVNKKEALNKTQ